MHRQLVIAVALVMSMSATSFGQRQRSFTVTDLTEVTRVTDPQGDRLANPQRITVCGDIVSVLDLGDAHVTAVSVDGKILWRAGRSGSGPGEFRSPGSISCDADGRLWVPDRGNARINIIARDGTFGSAIPVDQGIRRLAIAAKDSILWATTSGGADLALQLDRSGKTTRVVGWPEWLKALNSLQREPFVAPAPDGALIVAFRWSSTLLRISPKGVIDTIGGIEPMAFPEFKAYPTGRSTETMLRIDPAAAEAAQSLSVNGDTINVLFAGRSPNKGRIVDRYLTNGRYVGSVLLPTAPLDAVIVGTRIYTLLAEPEPAIVTLGRKPKR